MPTAQSTSDRTEATCTSKRARPFLKWAGGKGQLLPELMGRVTGAGSFGRYHEPFVGGGALFFELHSTNRLGRKRALLSDNNPRLIEAYLSVRDLLEDVLEALGEHAAQHDKSYYYEVRSTVPETLAGRAARIIYLNKTCFNGLFRENSRGGFNVPMGKYKKPTICDEANLRAVSTALQRANIEQRHFESVVEHAAPGDLVYFDPPYHPLSPTSSFTSYAAGGFEESDQEALSATFRKLDAAGVRVVLSNSDTPLIRTLYRDYRIEVVYAARSVNSRSDRRGKIPELIIRNF